MTGSNLREVPRPYLIPEQLALRPSNCTDLENAVERTPLGEGVNTCYNLLQVKVLKYIAIREYEVPELIRLNSLPFKKRLIG